MGTVAKVRHRFVDKGMEGALNEKPRPGQKPKLSGRDEAMLTAIACSDPPEGYGRWTIRLLADNLWIGGEQRNRTTITNAKEFALYSLPS